MYKALLVMAGGGLGSLLRYWLSIAIHLSVGKSFPCGTLFINALGSFLMGFLSILLLERMNAQSEFLHSLILIGFLGGFTTFSAFSMETLHLIEDGEVFKSFLNILLSFVLCITAVGLGAFLARKF